MHSREEIKFSFNFLFLQCYPQFNPEANYKFPNFNYLKVNPFCISWQTSNLL